jgi:hypothetical protein
MTWGTVIDTRRALISFGLAILILLVGLFLCLSLLANGNVLTMNYVAPIAPPISTVVPIQ